MDNYQREEEAIDEQRFIDRGLRRLRKSSPDMVRSYMDFWRATKKSSPIPAKYKELIQLAVVIHSCCKPCIFLHTRLCLQAGATPDEIIDATMQAVAMGGGISYEYAGYVMAALEYETKESTPKQGG